MREDVLVRRAFNEGYRFGHTDSTRGHYARDNAWEHSDASKELLLLLAEPSFHFVQFGKEWPPRVVNDEDLILLARWVACRELAEQKKDGPAMSRSMLCIETVSHAVALLSFARDEPSAIVKDVILARCLCHANDRPVPVKEVKK